MSMKTMVRVGEIFESELLPIFESDPELREIHKQAMKNWSKARGVSMDCLEDEHDAWNLTTSDFYWTQAQDRLEDSGLLTEETTEDEYDELVDTFLPGPKELGYYVSRHACHSYVVWALCLAHAWDHNGKWKIYESKRHSTVVSEDGRVFDVLLWDEPLETVKNMIGTEAEIWHPEDKLRRAA